MLKTGPGTWLSKTYYFFIGDFSYPLASANSENGTAGAITITFSNLLKEMWSEEHSPVRPDELKVLIHSDRVPN